MRKLLSLYIVIAGAALAQPSGTPNCQYNYTLTNRTTEQTDGVTNILVSGGVARTPSINNRQSVCSAWVMNVAVDGFSAVSLELDSSANIYTTSGGTPLAWSAFQGTVSTGTNPTTTTTSTYITYTGYYPWLSVNLNSSTGTGSIYVTLYGYKSPAYIAGAGTTGSSGTSGGSTTIINQSINYSANQPTAGCGVAYTSGLSFTVGSCTYWINGTFYTSPLTNKTLSAADPTNPRLDVIGVDNTGSVIVITGTAAANPAVPSIDPTQQLLLTTILVPANGSTPSNISTVTLYDENTEWTCSPSSNIVCASTTNPYSQTKDIEATGAVLTNNFTLVKPASGTVDLGTFNNLIFYIRSKGQWPTGTNGANAARFITLTWQNGTTQKGAGVVIKDGQFGFVSSNTTSYQQISIPTSLFGIAGVAVTTLVATVSGPSGSGSFGWYIDLVTLQGGSGGGTTLPTTTMNFKGTWNSTTNYNANDTVVSNGVGYIALVSNTNIAVTTSNTWAAIGGSGGGGQTLLESHIASNSAELDFTNWLSSGYDDYMIEFVNVYAATNATVPEIQMSTNGGSSYDTGANYNWVNFISDINSTANAIYSSTSATGIFVWGPGSSGLPNTGNYALNVSLRFNGPASTSLNKSITGHGSAPLALNSHLYDFNITGNYVSTTAVNAFRVIMSSGNIASGIIRIYGLSNVVGGGGGTVGSNTATIASGSSALGTSAISSGACATVVTGSAAGVLATDNIMADFNADPTSTTGYSPSSSGMLTIIKYPTAGTVNFKVCNNTSGSITPGAATLNWRVTR